MFDSKAKSAGRYYTGHMLQFEVYRNRSLYQLQRTLDSSIQRVVQSRKLLDAVAVQPSTRVPFSWWLPEE